MHSNNTCPLANCNVLPIWAVKLLDFPNKDQYGTVDVILSQQARLWVYDGISVKAILLICEYYLSISQYLAYISLELLELQVAQVLKGHFFKAILVVSGT